jgi:hypothetical protein
VTEPAPPPADDAFARRLWRPAFIRQVRIASKPVIPAILRPDHDDLIQEALIRAYTDILNAKGAESRQEREFLAKYAGEDEVLALLHGVRAVKALFEAYGDFPDVRPGKGARRGRSLKTI